MGQSTESRQSASERARSLASTAATAAIDFPKTRTRGVRLVSAFAALAGLVPLTVTRIALNSPVVLPSVASGAWFDVVTTGAVVGPALAAVLLGVTAEESWTRIGLVLVGVFGLLSLASTAAALSAIGAIVVGSWFTLAGAVEADQPVNGTSNRGQVRAGVVAVVLLGGLTLSLFGAVGVRPAALRSAGTTLTLTGMAATPLALQTRPRPSAFAVGGLAAGLTVYLTGAAPFVSGAVVLIAGSVVGASAFSLAIAVGGLTATVATGILNRRTAPAAVGLLLLTAGVPSSIPRALGVALAVAFVVAPTVADGGTSA